MVSHYTRVVRQDFLRGTILVFVLPWWRNVHIPDGFLSTPVWVGLDAAAVPAVALIVRRAQSGFAESRVPLLGMMGAFVFAAQMVNFPVGIGTSGHLVGGALLAVTLGPAAAAVVMTAILALQALVFQDGGVLALGANVLNMAIAGVIAGYLPYHFLAGTRWRKFGIFAGGMLSVLVSALLAIGELALSRVPVPLPVLGISAFLFFVSAVLEGAITLAVAGALSNIGSRYVAEPSYRAGYSVAALGLAAGLLAVGGVLVASQAPDGLERFAEQVGIASHAKALIDTPFADYQASFLAGPWLRKAVAGLAGLVMIFVACAAFGRWASRRRSA
jgi:cobalt/nickel transport system permease protein